MSGGDGVALKHWKRAAYGFGDFGSNLYWTTVSFFILYYYTDVVGLSGTVAGLIFLVVMLWDGIIDPVMGYYAQRTKSRWGSYRPYFLFGAIPLALSLILTFYNPGLEGAALISYVLLTHKGVISQLTSWVRHVKIMVRRGEALMQCQRQVTMRVYQAKPATGACVRKRHI